ncbi:MAG: CaiB/BaiF CoA transferase family protein [Paracoccaceae bacterium]
MPTETRLEPTEAGGAAGAEATPLPLSGIRAIEFSHMVMGPSIGMILGDLGADVIKVEPIKGDNTRRLTGSGAGFFPMYNRNKRSLAVDIRDPRGFRLVEALIRGADVLIENFRPGALEALGLGEAAMRAANPRLIYCSAKGFLPGPYAHRTALDEVVQMMAGLAYMTGPSGRPLRAGASVNDVMGGMFAVIGILAALRERDATGAGRRVTSALFENCVFLVGQHMLQAAVTGTPAPPMPERQSAWAIYDVFDAADGQLFVGVVSDTQWRAFCSEFGLGDLLDDPALRTNPARCAARPRFLPRIREILRELPLADALARAEAIGLPVAPINRPEDLIEDPQLAAAGSLLPVSARPGETAGAPAIPLALDDWRPGLRRDVPAIGADSRAIAAEAGLTADEIARLQADGVLGGGER